jgi:hypothetical protein
MVMVKDLFHKIYREKYLLGHRDLTNNLNRMSLGPDERNAVLGDLKNQFEERCLRKIKYRRLRTKGKVVAAIRRQAKDVFLEWRRKHFKYQYVKKDWGRLHKADVQDSELSSMEVKDQLAFIRKHLEKEEFDLFYYHGLQREPLNELSKIMKKRPEALRTQFGRVRRKIRKFFGLL